jgi:hypothetical protein
MSFCTSAICLSLAALSLSASRSRLAYQLTLRTKKAFLSSGFAVYVRAFGTLNYALWLSAIVVNLAIGRTTCHTKG